MMMFCIILFTTFGAMTAMCCSAKLVGDLGHPGEDTPCLYEETDGQC